MCRNVSGRLYVGVCVPATCGLVDVLRLALEVSSNVCVCVCDSCTITTRKLHSRRIGKRLHVVGSRWQTNLFTTKSKHSLIHSVSFMPRSHNRQINRVDLHYLVVDAYSIRLQCSAAGGTQMLRPQFSFEPGTFRTRYECGRP